MSFQSGQSVTFESAAEIASANVKEINSILDIKDCLGVDEGSSAYSFPEDYPSRMWANLRNFFLNYLTLAYIVAFGVDIIALGNTDWLFWSLALSLIAGWSQVLQMNIRGELTTIGEFTFYNTHRTALMTAVTLAVVTWQTGQEGQWTNSLLVSVPLALAHMAFRDNEDELTASQQDTKSENTPVDDTAPLIPGAMYV